MFIEGGDDSSSSCPQKQGSSPAPHHHSFGTFLLFSLRDPDPDIATNAPGTTCPRLVTLRIAKANTFHLLVATMRR